MIWLTKSEGEKQKAGILSPDKQKVTIWNLLFFFFLYKGKNTHANYKKKYMVSLKSISRVCQVKVKSHVLEDQEIITVDI